MAIYHYTAEDATGRRTTGQLEAAGADEARRLLEQQGLRVLEVLAAESLGERRAPSERLSPEEAQRMAEHVAEVGRLQLPLAAGLRAVAEESDSPRLAAALEGLAAQIEQGRSLEEALASARGMLPRHVTGLVAAATRTGQLGAAMSELAEHQRAMAGLRRGVLGGLGYPLLVASLALALFLFMLAFVAGGWERLFSDFAVELPVLTKVFFWWRNVGLWVVAGLLVGLAMVAALARRRMGEAGWQRLLAAMPVVGPLRHLTGLAEWMGLLVVLIRHQVPLPEALRLAAEGASNAHIERLSLSLAEGVARGRGLSQLIAANRQVPTSLAPLVRWGEKAGNLAESLATGHEMLVERVRMRSFWLQITLPPVLFLAIGCGALMVVGALFLPLINLLSKLT